MINDFEQGLGSIPLNSAVYRNQNSTSFNIFECNIGVVFGSIFTPPGVLNNTAAKASIMTAVNEPILSSYGITYPCVGPDGGKYSIRLNNSGGGQDITSYTQTFMPVSKYLSFDYLAVLNSPHITQDDVQPFFTVRLLDINNNIISSVPFCAKATLNDLILTKVSNKLFYTEDFYCQTIAIPEEYVNNQNIKVQFVIADCGLGGDVGVVYLDNIRMGDPCEEPEFGFIDLDSGDNICNPDKVTVTGTYTAPQGTTYTSSVLQLLDSAGNPVAINPADITLNNFSGGTFSYTVRFPAPLADGGYEIKVEAVFTNAIGYQYHLEAQSISAGADLIFSDPYPLNVTIILDKNVGMFPPGSVTWEDAGDPYLIEYVSDGYCCVNSSGGLPIDGQIHTVTAYDNNILSVLGEMQLVTNSKCLRFRVKTPCKKWSTWCCITSYGWYEGGYDPTNPDDIINKCLDEIDLNNLHPHQPLVAYPNPASGTISVMNANAVQFSFYDLNQKAVKQVQISAPEEKVKIDLSDLKNGVYILKTEQGQEVKIIKKKSRLIYLI
jgi:hypothetical protein